MREYRKRRGVESDPVQTPKANAADKGTAGMDKYLEIAAYYGLNDMEIGESEQTEQTVDEEFQAYVTASLSPKNVEILKFWEVNDLLMIF